MAFRPAKAGGPLLAVAVSDGTVRLLNGSTLTPAAPPLPLVSGTEAAESVAFSPDGRLLAAGADDGTVWLWNLADPAHPALTATLSGLAGHVFSVAFSPSGSQLAAASYDDDTVRLWDTSAAAARSAICRNLGQPVSAIDWASHLPGVPYRAPCS